MPGVTGELEELFDRAGPGEGPARRELVDAGIAWALEREAKVIRTTIGLDAPWTGEELSFWTSLGFEYDQTVATRYFLDDGGC